MMMDPSKQPTASYGKISESGMRGLRIPLTPALYGTVQPLPFTREPVDCACKRCPKAGDSVEALTRFEVDAKTQYELWADLHSPTTTELKQMEQVVKEFLIAPKISIVTPVHKTPETFLKKCIDSVLRQIYTNWELVLVDDASQDHNLTRSLMGYAENDSRIRVNTRLENGGIAAATNEGIAVCEGEYIALLDHDDELSADALYQIVKALNEDPSTEIFYSDEDKIGPDGTRMDGFFKPEWSPELLHSMNYVCHFLVCSRPLLESVDGLRLGFDGSQDYDLILRLSERTDKIKRIPRMLYHWRMHPQSTAMISGQKPKASDSGRRALEDHLERTGVAGSVEEVGICRYRVRSSIQGNPEISIIIPAGGSEKLKAALDSIFRETTYQNYRVIVVDNSPGEQVRRWVSTYEAAGRSISLLDRRRLPFNFSKLCNDAADQSKSPYLLFLNDDTSVITPDWLESMLEHAQKPGVGAVGAQLLFPNNSIQHAGVVVGIVGVAAHVFRGFDSSTPHYFAFSQSTRNYAAVTGACLFTRRDVFEKVGRFDEVNLPTCFQDVDLCLKMVDAGYRVVYTPYARLYHYESATKQAIANASEVHYMEDRWATYIAEDPFYNPNLTKGSDRYELDLGV